MGSFLFYAFSWWAIALRVVAIVHFIRRRPDFFWLFVILFHWVGALVYILVEVVPDAACYAVPFRYFLGGSGFTNWSGRYWIILRPATSKNSDCCISTSGICASARVLMTDQFPHERIR